MIGNICICLSLVIFSSQIVSSLQVNYDAFDKYSLVIWSGNHTPETSERLFLEGDQLVINCRFINDSIIPVDILNLNHSLNAAIQPIISVQNSSWVRSYNMSLVNNSSLIWEYTLDRQGFTYGTHFYLPKEEWTVSVVLEFGLLSVGVGSTTLLDIATEPFLQWDIGQKLDSPPANDSTFTKFVTVQSPCSPDVTAVFMQKHNDKSYILVSLSYNLFDNQTYYNISKRHVCPDCREVEVLDAHLTSHHLVILTTEGVFVTNDLRYPNFNPTDITFEAGYLIDSKCDNIMDFSFEYTSTCQSRQHDAMPDEVVTYSYMCHNGDSVSLYSASNFTYWSEYPIPETDAQILSITYNQHLDAMTALFKKNSGDLATETRPMWNGSVSNETVFPEYTFPADASVTRLAFQPMSMTLYAYHEQIWISSDSGNSFSLLHPPCEHLGHITKVAFGSRKDMSVFHTHSGSFLLGKGGVHRLATINDSRDTTINSYIITSDHSIYSLSMTSDEVMIRADVVDVTNIIKNTTVSPMVALGIQYLSQKSAILFEYNHNYNTSVFGDHSVGLEITSNCDGHAVITSITHPSDSEHFLSKVSINLYSPFKLNTFNTDDVMKSEIHVLSWNATSGTAILHVPTATWTVSHLYTTVILPGTTSFILINYINSTHIAAVSVLKIGGNIHRERLRWYMVDLGIHESLDVAKWRLSEPKCRNKLQADPILENKHMFEMDVHDSMSFTTSVVAISGRGTMGDLALSLSSPGLLKLKSYETHTSQPPVKSVTVNITNFILRRGITAIRLQARDTSLLCEDTSYTVIIHSGCPCTKRLAYQFEHHQYISKQDYIYGDPRHPYDDRRLLKSLPVNYRPPSKLGIGIPTSHHIYNVDPSQPRPRNRFKISQNTGTLKQCSGKTNRTQCGCTDYLRYSSDAKHSDCKERVYRIMHPGRDSPTFEIQEDGKTPIQLTDKHIITLREINDRMPSISIDTKYLKSRSLWSEMTSHPYMEFHEELYDPRGINLVMNGSELYHYRAELIGGSHCKLYSEFQLYVDRAPIAYPLQYILNFTVAFLIGGVLFAVYLWYLSAHHMFRIRSTGPRCKDSHKIEDSDGLFHPDTFVYDNEGEIEIG